MSVVERLLSLYAEVDRRTTRIGKPSWEDIAYVRTTLHEILRSLPAEPAGDDVAITENRKAAAGLREHLRRMMLAVRITEERNTFADGYAAGLATALDALERIDWRETSPETSPVDASDAWMNLVDPVLAETTETKESAPICWCRRNGYGSPYVCGHCPFRGMAVPA